MDTGKAAFPVMTRCYTEDCAFGLVDGVQVRNEKFGLLFYNYKGPKIYFVPSGGLIADDFFEGHKTLGQLADDLAKQHCLPRNRLLDQMQSVLNTLEIKGLINGQPLC
jgi:putative mycofactocin binding protein MftB